MWQFKFNLIFLLKSSLPPRFPILVVGSCPPVIQVKTWLSSLHISLPHTPQSIVLRTGKLGKTPFVYACVWPNHSLIFFAMTWKCQCDKVQLKNLTWNFTPVKCNTPKNWRLPTWLWALCFSVETSNCSKAPKPEINMSHSWLGQMTELSNQNLQTETLKGISRLLLQQEGKNGLAPWLFFSRVEIKTVFPFSPMG